MAKIGSVVSSCFIYFGVLLRKDGVLFDNGITSFGYSRLEYREFIDRGVRDSQLATQSEAQLFRQPSLLAIRFQVRVASCGQKTKHNAKHDNDDDDVKRSENT